ncbi:hypothetical protein [Aeromicrobium sp. 179-A 4D2 NHS]|uniref:hypothetical protein n=1 Tax=Aeromicrobium sp. 179-A 4D2 NHS TaxID=3142375 RepID=UPI0039A1C537
MDTNTMTGTLSAEFATLGGVFVLVALLGYVICLWDLLPHLTETLENRSDALVYFLGPAIALTVASIGVSHPVSGWFFVAGGVALRFVKRNLDAASSAAR